jgi:transcription elongation factor Elf1
VQFLSPTFTPSELACKGEPQGQLPVDSTAQQVSDRIVDIDEAGEDCRQKLDHVKTKIDVYKEVTDAINAGRKPKR